MTIGAHPAEPGASAMSALAYAVSDTAVIAKRNLLRIPRQPDLWVSFTIQPIMFVLLFVYVSASDPDSGLRLRRLPDPGSRSRRCRSAASSPRSASDDLAQGPDPPASAHRRWRARPC